MLHAQYAAVDMPESTVDFLAREYAYLRGRERADFFMSIEPYVQALNRKRPARRAIRRLRKQLTASAKSYVTEQNKFVAQAKEIREDLARRAPEIDNTDMEQPDPRSGSYATWKYDSFAGFDDLVERDVSLRIGYPTIPGRDDNPGVVSTLLGILRGRFRAGVYGEDAGINAEPIRQDLDDIGRSIGNVASRHEHALRRFRQEARTLPGLAIARLAYFGSDLNPDPPIIETDEDLERLFDRTLREWGRPRTAVRQLVNGEQMDEWERDSAASTEEFLKGELDRLHQELTRRLATGGNRASRFVRDPWVRGIGTGIVAGIIVALFVIYVLGRDDAKPQRTVTIRTTTP